MLFKSSLDKTAIGTTVFIAVLFTLILGVEYYITAASGGAHYPVYGITIFFLVIFCLSYAFHPAGYKITEDALIICRPLSDVQIKRRDIKSITMVDKKEIRNCIRTLGVGGVFGYYGSFANHTLGCMTWYATRRDKAILIT